MDLASINSQIAGALANAKGVTQLAGTAGASGAAGGGFDFAATLGSALKSVSESQSQTSDLERRFQMDDPNVSLEQTMLSMNTSAMNFSAAVQVRNKLVQAYDQIMNMQV
jgi:flagellar hook-basal body complex protein FliE